MEPFEVVCPACQKALRVKQPELVGRRVSCPQCKEKFVLNQLRSDRIRTQNNDQPIAAFQRAPYFIMPLLRPRDVSFAVPVGNVALAQNFRQPEDESSVA